MTNYERIKKMSVEEMANFLYKLDDNCTTCCATYGNCYDEDCEKGVKKWLETETKIEIALTPTERTILENIDEEYEWIARDANGALSIYKQKPEKDKDEGIWGGTNEYEFFNMFKGMFCFVHWQDKEPYNIRELLKEG